MIKKIILFFFYCSFFSIAATAQADAFAGTWQTEYTEGKSKLSFSLEIATPEKGILYPAHITIQCDSFMGNYELLLVKKTARELAISKNKFARSETPFSIIKQLFFINGSFDISRDLKGQPTLNLRRIQTILNNAAAVTEKTDAAHTQSAYAIKNFLQHADLKLHKQSNIPWSSEYANRILSPASSPAYFGLTDTLYIPTRDGIINLSGTKKNDIATARLNGNSVVDMIELTKKGYTQDLLLDTGLNLLVLYADNFANGLPNKGKLNLDCGKKKITLDFANQADSAASFIAVKLFYAREKDKERFFDSYTPSGDRPLKENEKLLGTLTSTSRQLTFAIWDDAVEDGDSISIYVNGKWVSRGFPVKLKPQTIVITLDPGPNTIIFSADNLGSIAPNTSIIEIIDGKRRKSFNLATEIGDDNLIKVFYDVRE